MSGPPPRIIIANAPVSFGAFEVTVGIDPNTPAAEAVLDAVAEAGYQGIDLGPVGYLGQGDQLAERLSRRKLGLSGAYLELPFSEPESLQEMLPQLDALLDSLDSVSGIGALPPRPTLGDFSNTARRAKPGQAVRDHRLGLDEAGFARFVTGVERVADHCRGRGYEPTFHNETGTFIEAPWEIERMLEKTSVGLCLDTGHLIIGGGDPLKALKDWGTRINHLHVKDARSAAIAEIVLDAAPAEAIWERGAFCALGQGDLPLDAIFRLVRETFSGWLVIEQDILPSPEGIARAAADQRANLAVLRHHGL
ncbi:MAG TPA: sugar phosphate isomerase/epimerase [Acidisoma sp.]|jgi:inosose dehydratase|uniref:sugar phosphate isomerase/epimerase n=1 Tax=Acidisoma sp. TaxID=1872115 RepID=UPI002CD5859B|nr:sugar phosphate isomerase/epimerase [Acidisoma sp.]HTH99597.1 sugar phosphate isomerase/epimerase [Acidisoma sp.]